MDKALSWDEIKLRYPDEWVILADAEFNENEDTLGGIVVSHGLDLDAALAPVDGVKERLAIEYTGERHGGLISVQVEPLG